MKLYVNKKQGKWHVNVGFEEAYLKKCKTMAQFESKKIDKKKCFGTIYLAENNHISVVAHEIVHASIHFFQHYSDHKSLKRMKPDDFNMYMHESIARGAENMLYDYVEAVGRHRKYAFGVKEITKN